MEWAMMEVRACPVLAPAEALCGITSAASPQVRTCHLWPHAERMQFCLPCCKTCIQQEMCERMSWFKKC